MSEVYPARPIDSLATLRIDSLAQGGDGIAREPGQPIVFVSDTAPGDLVRARIVSGGRDFRRGELVEILEGGPGRRAPPCPEAGACGGCQWQHLADVAQDDAARTLLIDALRRIGHVDIDESQIAPTRGLTGRLHYRQRARLHLDLATGSPRLGFLRAGSHDVHAVERSFVLEPGLEALRISVVAALPDLAASLPGTRAELQADLPAPDRAAMRLEITHGAARQESLTAALEVLSRAVPNCVAMEAVSPRAKAVRGEPRVPYRRGTLAEPERFAAFLSPGGFMQASREGNLLLTTRVVESVRSLGLPAGARVLELFAGNGNFTLPLTAMGLEILACDSDTRGIENALLAAAQCTADLPVAPTFEVADADQFTRRLAAKGACFDVVILDPPRIGARDACEAITSLGARAVVYVSCDAATLARDSSILARAGFRLERAEPLTLFPQSAHFETVAVFRR